jgi:hypothetical protein
MTVLVPAQAFNWLPQGATHVGKIAVRTRPWAALAGSFDVFKVSDVGTFVYKTDTDNEYPGWVPVEHVYRKDAPELFEIAHALSATAQEK